MAMSIPLSRGLFAIVDDEDFAAANARKWHAKPITGRSGRHLGWYAVRKGTKGEAGTVYMHRWLLDPPRGFEVDHQNNDGLDNRRGSNLRLCTKSQNNANRRKQASLSGYRGVHFDRYTALYRVSIECRGRVHRFGKHKDPVAAARIYDREARRLFGEFARLNFPNEPTA